MISPLHQDIFVGSDLLGGSNQDNQSDEFSSLYIYHTSIFNSETLELEVR